MTADTCAHTHTCTSKGADEELRELGVTIRDVSEVAIAMGSDEASDHLERGEGRGQRRRMIKEWEKKRGEKREER